MVSPQRSALAECDMTTRRIGWLFVGAQVVLLLALVALPGSDHWPTPGSLVAASWFISLVGVALGLVAALRLGSSLTPTPVPSGRGELTTTGVYGLVRHPIYTAVLGIVIGIILRSGNLVAAAVGVVVILFFNVKARWEERQLAEHFSGYPEYASRTPRFVPRMRRR